MNRRDFLFFRRTSKDRVLEVSCRALYMHALNANAGAKSPDDDVLMHEPWMGEPPSDFQRPADEDWLRQIEIALQSVDLLKLLDHEWLASTDMQAKLEPVLRHFQERGGRVELASTPV